MTANWMQEKVESNWKEHVEMITPEMFSMVSMLLPSCKNM
jgi:hypothetical protein